MVDVLESAEFFDNPEPRCPVVLLLDTSGSMGGAPITALNQGLQDLERELKNDQLTALRVELSIVSFGNGGVTALDVSSGSGTVPFDATQAFKTVDQFNAPSLSAGGSTPMGEAMRRALSIIRDRKEIYKANGIDYFRPWIFLITDGEPTDTNWQTAAAEARDEESRKGVLIFPIGVQGANTQQLGEFSNRPPVALQGLKFSELFSWVSKSLGRVSNSIPGSGQQVPLDPTDSWGAIVV